MTKYNDPLINYNSLIVKYNQPDTAGTFSRSVDVDAVIFVVGTQPPDPEPIEALPTALRAKWEPQTWW